MAILDNSSQTITEGWRALNLFTDRHEAVRLFCSYLNDDPARAQILFLYGDGGNGKSLLLRFLREYCCKRLRPENWDWVNSKSDEEFVAEIKTALGTDPVPYALLDFGMKPSGDDRPQETFSGLLMLRRGLSGHNLNFSLFDFACIWYLHKTDRLTSERLRSLFPADAFDFASAIAAAITSNKWVALGQAVLNLFNKRSNEWFTLYQAKRQLDEERVAEIQRLEPETELIDLLPRLFAEDLNVSMSLADAPQRICLFFDTYEAFWGNQRNLSDDLFFQRDEWMRRLVGSVELSSGIVTVLAGRDRPRWAEASKCTIPQNYIDTFLVGHFKTADAQQFLERAGIEEAAMQQAMIEYAQSEPDQIHPLYLGLCADVVLAAREKDIALTPQDFAPQAANKGSFLVDRLMRYVDQEIGFAVQALSACRAFDRNLYFKLGELLKFQATAPAFEVLSRFSFVWRSEEGGEGWYRIHNLLRRLMHERHDSVTRSAHEALENYYKETEDVANVVNLLYHMNRLDWERGVENWLSVFESSLRISFYDLCRQLLELRRELIIESDFHLGRVSALEGNFFALLSMYDEARQEYLDAIAAYDRDLEKKPEMFSLVNKGSVWESLGVLQADFARPDEAVESYKKAIAVLDQALKQDPNDLAAHVNRGNALFGLGRVQSKAAQLLPAIKTINTAVSEYDFVLDLTPNRDTALTNKGAALETIGELQFRLSQHEAARSSYTNAIAALKEAARLFPDSINAHLNMGNALLRLGELHVELSEFEQAVESYERSLAAFDEVFNRSPNQIDAHHNKGTVLHNLAELQMRLSQYEKAATNYEAALKSIDALLKLAPGRIATLLHRGNTLFGLGDLHNESSRYEEAKQSYEAAIATYDEILSRVAGDISAYNNKATALRGLGELQFKFGQNQAALTSYNTALACIDEVFRHAPGSISAYNNRGGILLRIGEVQSALEEYKAAIDTYEQALRAFKHVLGIAPDHVDARQNMGNTLVNIGELQADLSQFESAVESYKEALTSYDQVLKYSPDNVWAYNNKATTLRSLGISYSRLSRDSEAVASYVAAVAACDEALKRSPDFATAFFNKSSALHSHASLMYHQNLHAKVIELCKLAIDACEKALQYSPNNAGYHSKRAHLHGLMSMSQIELSQQNEALENIVEAVKSLYKALAIVPDDEEDLFLLNNLLETLRRAGFSV